MEMIEAYKEFWIRGFDFSGRTSRGRYWWYWLMNVIIMFVLINIIRIDLFRTVYYLLTLIPGIAITMRRLHDVNKKAWVLIPFYISSTTLVFSLLFIFFAFFSNLKINMDFMAILIIISILILGVLGIYIFVLLVNKGDSGINRFGPPYGADMPNTEPVHIYKTESKAAMNSSNIKEETENTSSDIVSKPTDISKEDAELIKEKKEDDLL